jgi:uncharacterized membrane protein YccC
VERWSRVQAITAGMVTNRGARLRRRRGVSDRAAGVRRRSRELLSAIGQGRRERVSAGWRARQAQIRHRVAEIAAARERDAEEVGRRMASLRQARAQEGAGRSARRAEACRRRRQAVAARLGALRQDRERCGVEWARLRRGGERP